MFKPGFGTEATIEELFEVKRTVYGRISRGPKLVYGNSLSSQIIASTVHRVSVVVFYLLVRLNDLGCPPLYVYSTSTYYTTN